MTILARWISASAVKALAGTTDDLSCHWETSESITPRSLPRAAISRRSSRNCSAQANNSSVPTAKDPLPPMTNSSPIGTHSRDCVSSRLDGRTNQGDAVIHRRPKTPQRRVERKFRQATPRLRGSWNEHMACTLQPPKKMGEFARLVFQVSDNLLRSLSTGSITCLGCREIRRVCQLRPFPMRSSMRRGGCSSVQEGDPGRWAGRRPVAIVEIRFVWARRTAQQWAGEF